MRISRITTPPGVRRRKRDPGNTNPPPRTPLRASRIGPSACSDSGTRCALPVFIDSLVHAPVLLLVTVDLSVVAAMDQHLPRIGVVPGASVYPFVWNILLAARNEGLGGILTTFLVAQEPQVKALFGIPSSHALAAMVPIGRPVRQLTRLARRPVGDFATVDGFDGATFPVGGPGR